MKASWAAGPTVMLKVVEVAGGRAPLMAVRLRSGVLRKRLSDAGGSLQVYL